MSESQIARSVALEALRGAHDECRAAEAERDAAVARAEAAEAALAAAQVETDSLRSQLNDALERAREAESVLMCGALGGSQ
jgi:predicted glycoside hydrolase/deacetylase ChbG (UPF0249 family)